MDEKFCAPEGWESYFSSVVEKTRLLIRLGIWDDIDELDLNSWLKNFSGTEGKYFSACILDALIYRSRKMCHSMLRNIVDDIVPNYCRSIDIANFSSLHEWRENLSNGHPLVRFMPVTLLGNRAKSSAVVAREFLQANDLLNYVVQSPENINRVIDNGTELIVFIDDIAGSGRQFVKSVKEHSFVDFKNRVNFLYCPLAAHLDAIQYIEERLDFVRVYPVDKLIDQHSFFFECSEGFFRGDKKNTVQCAKEYYESIFPDNSVSARKYRYGRNSKSLTYSFSFSTPNNNLKAIYHHEEGIWNRLVFRAR